MSIVEQSKLIIDEIYQKTLEDSCSDEQTTWIEIKHGHSYDVLNAGIDIYKITDCFKEFDEVFENYALSALLLHDIGRFYQFKDGKIDKTVKHGELGVNILNRLGIDNVFVCLGVKYHDRLEFYDLILNDVEYLKLSENDKIKALNIAMLVRDADRIANYRMHQKSGIIQIVKRNVDFKINENALNSVYEKKMVDWVKVKNHSIFDFIILILCWQNDIHFVSSKIIIKNEKVNDFLISEMNKKAKEGLEYYKSIGQEINDSYNKIINIIKDIESFIQIHY